MSTSKIIGIILIVCSLAVGYLGFNKLSESSKSVNLLGLEIEASNESGKEQGYIYLGLAVVLFVGGIYTIGKSKS